LPAVRQRPRPHAQVTIYPDSAHGFLFQHHAEFAADADAFLTAAS
jgi:pimeloyl-ACP methyl ester carboxylesterase